MFSQTYLNLDNRLYRLVLPTVLDNPKLVHRNTALINKLKLHDKHLDWQAIIAGRLDSLAQVLADHNAPFAPLAMAYAGHQFGQWAGQLGDGRAILLTQVRLDDKLYDLQLKGAGRTPYARHGDGRAMIDSTVREYLCGHALNHLNITSSDALGLVVSDTYIARHQYERAASLLRVSDCHIRLGHFEWVAAYAPDYLTDFTETMIKQYYPAFYQSTASDVAGFLMAIAERIAVMIANWQLIGFSHGVINTDNMTISGTTLDFGPFGFMEGFDPTWLNNHSDINARYCYQNQPTIGQWNLSVFVRLFSKLGIDEIQQMAVLEHYEKILLKTYNDGLMAKLGIKSGNSSNKQLSEFVNLGYRFLQLLQKHKADYTNSFRALVAVINDKSAQLFTHEHHLLKTLTTSLSAEGQNDLMAWIKAYRLCLAHHQTQHQTKLSTDNITQTLLSHNPAYILRNHMAQHAIEQCKIGDNSEIYRLFELLSQPHQVQNIATKADTRMAAAHEQIAISCLS